MIIKAPNVYIRSSLMRKRSKLGRKWNFLMILCAFCTGCGLLVGKKTKNAWLKNITQNDVLRLATTITNQYDWIKLWKRIYIYNKSFFFI